MDYISEMTSDSIILIKLANSNGKYKLKTKKFQVRNTRNNKILVT